MLKISVMLQVYSNLCHERREINWCLKKTHLGSCSQVISVDLIQEKNQKVITLSPEVVRYPQFHDYILILVFVLARRYDSCFCSCMTL